MAETNPKPTAEHTGSDDPGAFSPKAIAKAQARAKAPTEVTSGDLAQMTGELEIVRQHYGAAEQAVVDAEAYDEAAEELEKKFKKAHARS